MGLPQPNESEMAMATGATGATAKAMATGATAMAMGATAIAGGFSLFLLPPPPPCLVAV